MTPQETDPDLPISVQESSVEVWVGNGLLQGWGTECSSACMGPFEGSPTLMAESEEELKSLLMKVKEESEEVGLKLNIHKTEIMASGRITSWEIDGETVSDFIFWGSKITTDSDCSREIKRRLLLGRKVMTNLDSILKNRDITLPTKVWSSQGYGFSSGHVWM